MLQISSKNTKKFYETIKDLSAILEKHTTAVKNNGQTATFWISFLEMVDILFAFNRSLRIGDWKMHLAATQKMLPWFFSYDRQNYSRYLTLYISDMIRLEETHPAVYKEFQ